MIDIEIAPTSLFQSIPDGTATPEGPFYNGVMATFCHISWDLQDDDPSSFPVFADLQQASFLCPGTRVTVDLWDVARQAEHYDTAMVQRVGERTVSVPPTAVIFHESKCGSTVVSNALAAYRLHHTRVYSEATAPLKALLVCRHNTNNTTNNNNIDENKGGINSETEISCDPDSRTKLIQDVFFMMGRVTRPQLPQYVFYKMPSRAVLALSTFVQAMPMTPWVFVYRDPIEVMMSQFQKDYQATSIAASGSSKANNDLDCLRTFGQPVEGQPMGLIELVAASSSTGDGGSKEWTDLTREEYCAAYIALLCQSAVQEHQRTKDFVMTGASYLHSISASVEGADGTALLASSAVAASHTVAAPRLFINYNELPFKVWETLIPLVVLLVKGSISHDEIELMQAATRVYSHGGRTGKKRPKKKDQQQQEKNIWKDDITLKQGQAPTSIKDAAHLFLDPVYAQLESIRTSMEHQSHP